MQKLIAEMAIWSAIYVRQIFLAAAITWFIWFAIIIAERRLLPKERWPLFLGGAFLSFSLYFFVLCTKFLDLGQIWKTAVVIISSLLFSIGSLFFLATARLLVHHKPKWYLEDRIHLPKWSIFLALCAVVSDIFASHMPWHKFVSLLLFFFCIILFGRALFKNFRPRGSTGFGIFSFILSLALALVNCFCVLIPRYMDDSGELSKNLLPALRGLAEKSGAIHMNDAFAGLASIGFILFGFALFSMGFNLMQASLQVWMTRKSSALQKMLYGNLEFFSSRGIVKDLGELVQASSVSLAIRLPGIEKKVMIINWGDDSGKAIRDFSELYDGMRSVFQTGEQSLDVENEKPKIALPIYYHGGVSACLEVLWKDYQTYTATSISRMEQLAELLAPAIYSKRQRDALTVLTLKLGQLGKKFRDEPPSLDLDGYVDQLAADLHDTLSPQVTVVHVILGFRSIKSSRGLDASQVDLDREDLLNHLGEKYGVYHEDILVEDQSIGFVILTVHEQCDARDRPTFVRDDWHRTQVASLVSQTITNDNRTLFAQLCSNLNEALFDPDSVTSLEHWLMFIKMHLAQVHIKRLYAVLKPGWDLDLVKSLDVKIKNENQFKVLRLKEDNSCLVFEENDDLEDIRSSLLNKTTNSVTQLEELRISENSAACRIRLSLIEANAELFLEFNERPPGNPWSNLPPWRSFLETVGQIADNALVRIEKQTVQDRNNTLELQMTKLEISSLLMHELRNLAASFSYGTDRVIESLPWDPDSADNWGKTEKARKRLTKLKERVGEFMEIAKNVHHSVKSDERKVVGLTEVTNTIQTKYQSLFKNRAIRLHVDVAPSLKVAIPMENAYLALQNLVTNSTHAIWSNGDIFIKAWETETHVLCDVKDSGKNGIPNEAQSKIFDLGFTTKEDGTGWGLAIVRSSLQRLGGDLTLIDGNKGQTTFRLTLPKPPTLE